MWTMTERDCIPFAGIVLVPVVLYGCAHALVRLTIHIHDMSIYYRASTYYINVHYTYRTLYDYMQMNVKVGYAGYL